MAKLKQLIEEKTGVPSNYQRLHGYKQKNKFISDTTQIRDLYLPIENDLYAVNTSDNLETKRKAISSNKYKQEQEKRNRLRTLHTSDLSSSDSGHYLQSTMKLIEV